MLKMEKQLALIEDETQAAVFPKRLSKLNKPTVSNIKPAEACLSAGFCIWHAEQKRDQISQ